MKENIKKEKIKELVQIATEISQQFQEPYRVKTFGIVLRFLLENYKKEIIDNILSPSTLDDKESINKNGNSFKGLSGGIEYLIQGGFFGKEKTLKAIHEELIRNGYHYPKTSLPSALISLIRKKQLARVLGKDKLWCYILTK